MRERLNKYIDVNHKAITICTIHSFLVQWFKKRY